MELGSGVDEATFIEAKELVATGRPVEDLLTLLKDRGANAIASIRILQLLLGVTAAEAQQLVYDSEAWKEMR
jgi:hypothetical protein